MNTLVVLCVLLCGSLVGVATGASENHDPNVLLSRCARKNHLFFDGVLEKLVVNRACPDKVSEIVDQERAKPEYRAKCSCMVRGDRCYRAFMREIVVFLYTSAAILEYSGVTVSLPEIHGGSAQPDKLYGALLDLIAFHAGKSLAIFFVYTKYMPAPSSFSERNCFYWQILAGRTT